MLARRFVGLLVNTNPIICTANLCNPDHSQPYLTAGLQNARFTGRYRTCDMVKYRQTVFVLVFKSVRIGGKR